MKLIENWREASVIERLGFVVGLPFAVIVFLAVAPIALIAYGLYCVHELLGLPD